MPVFPPLLVPPGDPGGLITDPGQYEYSATLLGHGTPNVIEKVTGLYGAADINDHDSDRQDAHGRWPGLAFAGGRTVDFDVRGSYASWVAAEDAMEALNYTFRYEQGFLPFVFSRPGRPLRYVNAEVRRREFDSSYEQAHGLLTGSVELFCADPRKYTIEEFVNTLVIPNGQTIVQGTVYNGGNAGAGFTAEIQGPATNPVLQNVDDGNKAVRFKQEDGSNLIMSGSDVLIVDVAHRTVLLNGSERYDLVQKDSVWWHLRPGNNRINYSRQDMSASSSCTITHRDVTI